jgi:molybdate transport system substrate-binding protein
MIKPLSLLTAISMGTGASSLAAPSQAAELKVMSSIALRDAYRKIVPEFERATGHKVNTTFVGGVEVSRRINAGEIVDLVIMSGDAIDVLIQAGKLTPGSRVDLAKSGIGIAAKAGAPKPDVSTVDALKRALIACKSFGFSTGPSGVYLQKLFEQMGLGEALKQKGRQSGVGEPVATLVARGDVEIGFQQISEILPVAGIQFLGPLPQEVQLITLFSSGLHAQAPSPAVAKALVDFITGPSGVPLIKQSGMEPAR